jgi:hypothetical protein
VSVKNLLSIQILQLSEEQNAVVLPLQCGPSFNFGNTKQKDIKFDECLLYAHSYDTYYSETLCIIDKTTFLYMPKYKLQFSLTQK